MSSPTQRTLARLRRDGHVCQVVEKWSPFARKRIDLFGVIDVLAVKGSIVGVQATSDSNHSARVNKALAEPRLRAWLEAGGKFEVWSWGKRGKRGERKLWRLRKTEITLGMLGC